LEPTILKQRRLLEPTNLTDKVIGANNT